MLTPPILDIDLEKLNCNESTRLVIQQLLNYIEYQHKETVSLKHENQRLKDEINRLKGEQGKPDISPNTKHQGTNISSEAHSREKKKWKKRSKKSIIKVDNHLHCPLEKEGLPPDLQFKGRETIISQDIIFQRNTTEYTIEIWYSPSKKRTYRSSPPTSNTGYFGENLKAFCITMYYALDTTQSKLLSFLRSLGIEMSDGSLQNILAENSQQWIDERNDILKAGLQGPYIQMDSTGTRVNGHNHYTHVFVSEFFAAFTTQSGKSRLDILAAFQGQPTEGLMLQYNDKAVDFLVHYKLSKKYQQDIEHIFLHNNSSVISQIHFEQLVCEQMPGLLKKKQTYKWIIESLAFGYFFEQSVYPAPEVIVTDDAKEYSLLSEHHMLCWIHDARYYNKLMPVVSCHRKELEDFKKKYWDFYRLLKKYKSNPDENFKNELKGKFDQIFTPDYSYFDLNKQTNRTLSNKIQLLTVLDFPFIPLHNNDSELAARRKVRKRDISLHTITQTGTKLQDAFLSIVHTSYLLGVNVYQYILNRHKNCSPTYLPDLVAAKIYNSKFR